MPKLSEIIGEETFKTLPEEVKSKYTDTDFVDSVDYVSKAKYDEVSTRKKEIEGQIKGLNKTVEEYNNIKPQFESMKQAANENPLLKQQLEDVQNKLELYPNQIAELQKNNQEWENKFKQNAIDSAIKLGLSNAKLNPKYMDLLMGKFDRNKLELSEDGSVKGLEEQFKTIQEGYSELFGEVLPPGTGGSKGNNARIVTDVTQQSLEQLAQKARMSGREEDRIAYAKAKNQLAQQQTQ